jgi:hypothetical protein
VKLVRKTLALKLSEPQLGKLVSIRPMEVPSLERLTKGRAANPHLTGWYVAETLGDLLSRSLQKFLRPTLDTLRGGQWV